MRITLYTTYYVDRDPRRRMENEYCLRKNVECDQINEIRVFCQDGADLSFVESPKIIEIQFGARPRFSDFLEMVNETAGADDISIVANTDIYFGHELDRLRYVEFDRTVLALTRWDLREDGSIQFFGKADSQDAWIFKGRCKGNFGKFWIGQYGCDNRLAWEIREMGYRVRNPSLSLKSYHYHCSESRPYLKKQGYEKVPPPYLYVRPDTIDPGWRNLWSFFFDRERFESNRVDRMLYGWTQYKYHRMRVKRAAQVNLNLPGRLGHALGALWYYPYRKHAGNSA